MATAHFSITGEFITDYVRSQVLEDAWERGFRLLTEDIEGITADVALDILKGNSRLVGTDNLNLEDESPEVAAEYQKKLMFSFGCLYKHDGLFYRPDRVVTSWGEEDMYAIDNSININYLHETGRLGHERSKFYANKNETVFTLYNDHPGTHQEEVIFKLASTPPIFIEPNKTPEEAYESAIKHDRRIGVDGYSSRFGFDKIPHHATEEEDLDNETIALRAEARREAENWEQEEEAEREEQQFLEKIQYYRELISQQADEGVGWFDLYVEKLNKTYRIAKAPFIKWMSRSSTYKADFEKAGILIPEWNNVSEPGLKMWGDDVYHTDWFISAGFDDPSDAYGTWAMDETSEGKLVNEAAYTYMFRLFNEKLNIMSVPLVSNGIARGKIVFPKPHEDVEPGSIIVIPTAGPEYDVAARSAHSKGGGAIITEVGGKLCHLATVGRESNYRMVMVEDALSKYVPGMNVEVDSVKGTIKFLDF